MTFMMGLKAAIGGLILYVFAVYVWGTAQYTFPSLAAVFMWLGAIGIAVSVCGPAYYWVGHPLYVRLK